MSNPQDSPSRPVAPEHLSLAVKLYLEKAYGSGVPQRVRDLLPPQGDFDVGAWLMGDQVERIPAKAPLEEVISFSLRLGSPFYRHMKLRIARPGSQPEYVFLADAHDAFLEAEPGTPDYEGLAELKRQNAALVAGITAAWDAAGLNTEKRFLKAKILEARGKGQSRSGP